MVMFVSAALALAANKAIEPVTIAAIRYCIVASFFDFRHSGMVR
jgi:hypothetical protein